MDVSPTFKASCLPKAESWFSGFLRWDRISRNAVTLSIFILLPRNVIRVGKHTAHEDYKEPSAVAFLSSADSSSITDTAIQHFNSYSITPITQIRKLIEITVAHQSTSPTVRGEVLWRAFGPHSHSCQMYFSKITTFAIVAAFPAAFSSPILDARQDGTTCQTSSGSPLTGDVTAVINQLKGLGAGILCAQTNGEASGKSSSFPNE